MPPNEIKFDLKKLGLANLDKTFDPIIRQAIYAAGASIGRKAAIRSPKLFGELQNSLEIENVVNNTVRFGFNKSYAEVMDSGWKTPIIKPKKAKALFIPLTRKGARQGPLKGDLRKLRNSTGNPKKRRTKGKATKKSSVVSSAKRSTVSKRKAASKKKSRSGNEDFIFVKKVKTKKAVFGRRSGPNKYFSGTIKEMSQTGEIAQGIANYIKKRIGP